jgi:DNA-binding CsgD family transcriptional regulator
MARRHTFEVQVSARQSAILGRLSRSKKSAASLVDRARLILLAAAGKQTQEIASELGVNHQRVRRGGLGRRIRRLLGWTRWKLVANDSVLAVAIEEALSDRPPKFTPEQEQVRALACREPSEFGLPHSERDDFWPRRPHAKAS